MDRGGHQRPGAAELRQTLQVVEVADTARSDQIEIPSGTLQACQELEGGTRSGADSLEVQHDQGAVARFHRPSRDLERIGAPHPARDSHRAHAAQIEAEDEAFQGKSGGQRIQDLQVRQGLRSDHHPCRSRRQHPGSAGDIRDARIDPGVQPLGRQRRDQLQIDRRSLDRAQVRDVADREAELVTKGAPQGHGIRRTGEDAPNRPVALTLAGPSVQGLAIEDVEDRDHTHRFVSRLLVHEFVAGGGMADQELPPGLVQEGLGMLQALLADLSLCNDRDILTTLDARIPRTALPTGVEVHTIAPGRHDEVLRRLLQSADRAWIIAPESGGRLLACTELARRSGVEVVGSTPGAIRLASDKLRLSVHLRQRALPVPRTWPASAASRVAEQTGFPLMVKPRIGAGCEGVRQVRDWPAMVRAIEGVVASGASAIIQEYIEGVPASASVLCARGRANPISLNGQEIRLSPTCSYGGGWVPLEHASKDRALQIAGRACETIPGLAGYVGVDLVLGREGPTVIEVNPRLTTSYIGLRAASDRNLAALILDAAAGRPVPVGPIPIVRRVHFGVSGAIQESGT